MGYGIDFGELKLGQIQILFATRADPLFDTVGNSGPSVLESVLEGAFFPCPNQRRLRQSRETHCGSAIEQTQTRAAYHKRELHRESVDFPGPLDCDTAREPLIGYCCTRILTEIRFEPQGRVK
jgi:hypothetical protein